MADVHTKEQRGYNMSRIRSSKTKTELKFKSLFKALGFTYQPKNVYGKPDFIHKKEKIAVFVDGCFWHGCPKHFRMPKSNRKFWSEKIRKNAERDKIVTKNLRKDGWKVLRVWEHNIKR